MNTVSTRIDRDIPDCNVCWAAIWFGLPAFAYVVIRCWLMGV